MSTTHTTIRTCDACKKEIPKKDSRVELAFSTGLNEWGYAMRELHDLCTPCATGFGLDVLVSKEETNKEETKS
jgi:hypothetical protein